jgi:hypothetical protein
MTFDASAFQAKPIAEASPELQSFFLKSVAPPGKVPPPPALSAEETK